MFNRSVIRNSLSIYKEATRQHEEILQDQEIQSLFEKDNGQFEEYYLQAKEVIQDRYPLGEWATVTRKGLELIEVMVKDIPQWKGIEPMEVWSDPSIFKEFLELAEQV